MIEAVPCNDPACPALRPTAGLLLAAFAAVSLAACGGDTQTFEYPSESMEPTISYHEDVTVDLDAYEDAQPAVGDIVAFHPPAGHEGGECGTPHPPSQPCPEAIGKLADEVFIKRVVAGPGAVLSIRDGLPVIDGEAILSGVIQQCSGEGCNLPKPIPIPPGHYFVMGDNSGASEDSRYWGPIPLSSIFGKAEG